MALEFPIELEFRNVDFYGFEPGPHWWEANAITTVPSLLLEETYFLEITQVFSSSAVTDYKELVLTLEDVNTFRSLLDQLNEFQQLLQHVLVGIFTVCV